MVIAKTLVLTAAAALLVLPCTILADETPVCRFTGTVTLDGADVPDGTVITAIIGDDEFSTITPTGYGTSTYSIAIVQADGTNYPDGTVVSFRIDGYAAQQTGTLENGKNIRCDLSASTTPTQVESQNAWLIFGLVAASIVEVLLVGGVARIAISNWNS